MKDKNRLTIGFMIHHLDNDYSKTLLKGAVSAAEDSDVNLVIFPGRSLNSQLDDRKYTAYEYQNNVIYSYASCKSLDALIISAGTLGSFVTKEEFKAFVDGFEDLPVITTENKVRGYPCIRLSGSGIKDIINHLIKQHGRKHIAFVSGPKGNADADERLEYYKEALEENGMEYDPEMVAYGKFSEYCVDIVGDLIDRNMGKIDAICFANDMMCKGGYKAIEKRGLKIGKDIAVTGYDDSEIASWLKPALTTVRADASKLGYSAVKEAIKLVRTGESEDILSLRSSPVFRRSCGCAALFNGTNVMLDSVIGSSAPEKTASMILSEYIPDSPQGYNFKSALEELKDFMIKILEFASNSGADPSELKSANYRSIITALADKGIFECISADVLINIIKALQYSAVKMCGSDSGRIVALYDTMEYCLEIIASRTLTMHYSKMDDLTFTHFLISNITKDMTIYGSDEEKCYFSIVNNLYRIHMASSYIYTYSEPIIHTNKMEWRLPETIQLKAYHDGDRLTALTGDAQQILSSDFFCNDHTPTRRRTMIVSPLFMNEEQYGIIVSELEYEYFPYIYSVTPQICTAIKLTKLVGQLESSLDAAQYRNNLLNRISMCDELTGVYNRRGFYEFTNRIFRAPENEGKHAVLIFGDLDNLKKINDSFGHDDGDYAITSAASFLKSGLRHTDIVARIGGDEFAAFALCEDQNIIRSIPERIKNIAKFHNLKSSKPYNVTISIGTYELDCNPEHGIQAYMDKADAALYADKKNKNPDIMKADFAHE
ncbi:MAG: diguanylate cyclase [Huintestinicola sp.]